MGGYWLGDKFGWSGEYGGSEPESGGLSGKWWVDWGCWVVAECELKIEKILIAVFKKRIHGKNEQSCCAFNKCTKHVFSLSGIVFNTIKNNMHKSRCSNIIF